MRRKEAFTIIAEIDGQIGGFLVGESLKSRAHLITLDVLEKFRRNGIGSKLMIAAENVLKSRQCQVVFLETAVDNLTAITFYKRHEYVVLKTIPRYYEGKLDALLMGKKLDTTNHPVS